LKKIYVEADLEAMKYFKLGKKDYNEILKTGICKLNKKNEVLDKNEIVDFINGFYIGQKRKESKNELSKIRK